MNRRVIEYKEKYIICNDKCDIYLCDSPEGNEFPQRKSGRVHLPEGYLMWVSLVS